MAETQNVGFDDPYSAELTGYDLKKTLAVILDDVLRRIDQIESKLSNLTNSSPEVTRHYSESINSAPFVPHTARGLKMNNNEKSNYKKINYLDLLQDAQENCVVQARELPLYPECFSKIEWLRTRWGTHSCYVELGIDGSECSLIRYLSDVSVILNNFVSDFKEHGFIFYKICANAVLRLILPKVNREQTICSLQQQIRNSVRVIIKFT
ncbi:unnamed protein product [Schistosoma mattheei]|uniref:MGT5A-like N-terminal domain-containing protein n=1 Tax=Schistosoma mattheei TaxID=31246 RepID=A0A3P8FNV8_9TREM|nr:unnamed protein product [Schistosoma mattheei]